MPTPESPTSTVSPASGYDTPTFSWTCVSGITHYGLYLVDDSSTPAAVSGTITSSSTSVTGTNTLFLSQVAVGDLIGNSTNGFYRVTSITSNTSLMLASAPSPAFAGSTFE